MARATDSATTSALAPGQSASIWTTGGGISGNWATGRNWTDSSPMTTITRDTTEAMIGRSIKTWEVTRHPFFDGPEGDAWAGGPSPSGTAFTGAPGPIFINPLTTTRSPALMP